MSRLNLFSAHYSPGPNRYISPKWYSRLLIKKKKIDPMVILIAILMKNQKVMIVKPEFWSRTIIFSWFLYRMELSFFQRTTISLSVANSFDASSGRKWETGFPSTFNMHKGKLFGKCWEIFHFGLPLAASTHFFARCNFRQRNWKNNHFLFLEIFRAEEKNSRIILHQDHEYGECKVETKKITELIEHFLIA